MFKGTCIVLIFLFNFILLQLKQSDQSGHETPTVKVKMSGDGARMSHSGSLFVCSFSLLDQGQQVLSSAGMFYTLLISIAVKAQGQ